ncbi:hypothetical protein FOA52_002960 [Chlamydomonas sp. UWO 241]|nr:hypothetical protein FOA52_002960 [Chlamydomonas sp. UWO 241]
MGLKAKHLNPKRWVRRPKEGNREIHVNRANTGKYKSNETSTTKYNLITFLPKALFEQYRRVANWYFTIVAALSLTAFSPVRPWTTWLPLAIVIGVSMIKEAIEDYKRYKADVEMNNRPVNVLDPDTREFLVKRWKDVRPGMIIEVKKDEGIPADMLFLSAETEEGTCYIETMNLDGETNLKIKKAPDESKDILRDGLFKVHGKIVCEPPNSRLYQFTGNLVTDEHTLSLNPACILLRGCNLRNSERIFGTVIYAGHDTKVFMNATAPPSKRSQVEHTVDKIIFFMFFLLFCFCITGAVYDSYWIKDTYMKHWYLGVQYPNIQYSPEHWTQSGGTNFITCFILYGYLIPISLYVSMEMVKITQSMVFISRDLEMYHADSDTPALARTSNLNEDLGMVNTVLSDKTGTLTRNVMEFFKVSISGVSYGAGVTEIERSNKLRRGEHFDETVNPGIAKYKERFFNFFDSRLMEAAYAKSEADPTGIEMFLRMLAVCHTVIPDGPETPEEIRYEAESPDEMALVVGAKALGFFFMRRTNTGMTVRETTGRGTEDVEYTVLNVLEFNSTRKRMSVIVRDSKGTVYLFCKGADTVIYERLKAGDAQNERLKEPTMRHMEEYGSAGLRTLCLSYSILEPAMYDEWQLKWTEAKQSMEDRDEKVEKVGEMVEKDLILLGCTAIEDKLQEGVPQCIAKLAEAGIRLWVLTGDKMETAINIGFACSLITEEMQQFIITASFKDVDELEAAGRDGEAAMLANERIEQQLKEVDADIRAGGDSREYAMVIDGKALSYALSERLSPMFLSTGLMCQAVICCRVSPLQKAQVTALVRTFGDVTLAIGDGANDVGMIQKAHIGVGISGQEGMQAVMAADFAIAQFRFLTPLLLVHGRWSYKRITRMICFFFFKNLCFGITLFAYNGFTTFSGQYMYSDVYMTLFNVVFTALTPIVIGIFDRDVDRAKAYKYPKMYRQTQKNTYFNFMAIVGWLVSSVYQCAVIFVFVMLGCTPRTVSRQGGAVFGTYETGVLMFSCIILTVHLQIASVIEQWTWIHHVSIWCSCLVWWIFLLIFDVLPLAISQDLFALFTGVSAGSPQYWFWILIIPFIAVMPDFFWRACRRQLRPADHELVMEEQFVEKQEARARARAGVLAGTGNGSAPAPGTTDNAPAAANAAAIFAHFEQNKNTGFVPPYDSKSAFYALVDNAGKNELHQAQHVRNPVLQHLDQALATETEMTTLGAVQEHVENPFREIGAVPSAPAPGGGGGASGSRVAPGPLPGQLRSPGTGNGFAARATGSATDAGAIAAANPHMSRDEAEMLATYASALDK